MNILVSIIALLQFAISFLATSAGTPNQPVAEEFAQQAITIAQEAIVAQSAEPAIVMEEENNTDAGESTASPEPAPQEPVNPPSETTTPNPDPEPVEIPEPKSQESIKIVTVNTRRGFDYQYKVTDEISPIDNDSQNEIYLGVVYYNEKGINNLKPDVKVESTDPSQNKVIKGTGRDEQIITGKVLMDGEMVKIGFYSYVYKFNAPGQHTIIFTVNGITESVTLTAISPESQK